MTAQGESSSVTAAEALSHWLARIEACHPIEMDLGLERIAQVAQRLQLDLSHSYRIVIGGTNGKGTTVRLLESILASAGLRVGTYTSPHFLRYNERMRIEGVEIDDATLCQLFERIDEARDGISLTYFEFGTLAALMWFSIEKPDVVLLEVGLGGRLDAVNLVDADIAVVTTVALDHMDWLGHDREAIGREKAGIYRAGRFAISGDPQPPQSLALTAQQLGADFICAGHDFAVDQCEGTDWSWRGRGPKGQPLCRKGLPRPQLPVQNAATALQVLALMPWSFTDEQIGQGLKQARLTGRMQAMRLGERRVLLDVAHNPESAAYLCQILAQRAERCHLLIGMLADKDVESVFSALQPQVDRWHLAALDCARAASLERLLSALQSTSPVSAEVETYGSVAQSLSVLERHKDAPLLVIAGSFYTVTDALASGELRNDEGE